MPLSVDATVSGCSCQQGAEGCSRTLLIIFFEMSRFRNCNFLRPSTSCSLLEERSSILSSRHTSSPAVEVIELLLQLSTCNHHCNQHQRNNHCTTATPSCTTTACQHTACHTITARHTTTPSHHHCTPQHLRTTSHHTLAPAVLVDFPCLQRL